MTDHSNDERTVVCPVEGCDATPLARGVYLHVRRSGSEGHGPQGEIPDDISLDDLETAGVREVEMDYPEERDHENQARLCPYCSQTFSGLSGLMIHLSQTAGRKNHPTDPKERHEPGDFPRVNVDENGNIEQVVDSSAIPEVDSGKAGVAESRVFRLIADLIADDEARMAHRVRRTLLGTDNSVAPNRREPPQPELFEALLTQGRIEETDHHITFALEGESVSVACRNESGILSPDEAREIARRMEQVAAAEGWLEEQVRKFISFLREGAEVLDGNKSEHELHEEFDFWR